MQRLESYVSRVISESQAGVESSTWLQSVGAADSEVNGIVDTLHSVCTRKGASLSGGHSLLISQALASVNTLNTLRSARLSALQSQYPPIHYGILMLLGGSILLAYLIESDQEALAFLDAVQLKMLFSVLVGVLTSAAFLLYDLAEPFRGSYQISPTAIQLYTIRDGMAIDRLSDYGCGSANRNSNDNTRSTAVAKAGLTWAPWV
mmetsp:Transcript_48260/g.95640  ORF Transcript_48260/g.95640 Transcript_48260/m.95640 type:complete len:205 (+) Transcript_48260:649-1263(+)